MRTSFSFSGKDGNKTIKEDFPGVDDFKRLLTTHWVPVAVKADNVGLL